MEYNSQREMWRIWSHVSTPRKISMFFTCRLFCNMHVFSVSIPRVWCSVSIFVKIYSIIVKEPWCHGDTGNFKYQDRLEYINIIYAYLFTIFEIQSLMRRLQITQVICDFASKVNNKTLYTPELMDVVTVHFKILFTILLRKILFMKVSSQGNYNI